MARTETITILRHENMIYEENDYVRIEMKPDDIWFPELASKYIGTICNIQKEWMVLKCGNSYHNIDIGQIDKMRYAHIKETFNNTLNFEDTYKEE